MISGWPYGLLSMTSNSCLSLLGLSPIVPKSLASSTNTMFLIIVLWVIPLLMLWQVEQLLWSSHLAKSLSRFSTSSTCSKRFNVAYLRSFGILSSMLRLALLGLMAIFSRLCSRFQRMLLLRDILCYSPAPVLGAPPVLAARPPQGGLM